MNVLIIGLGSISRKHRNALRRIYSGVKFWALRSSKSSQPEPDVIDLFDVEELGQFQFDFIIISSPSFNHLSDIKKYKSLGIPIFVEKPLLVNKKQILQLINEKGLPLIYVGCNVRFHPIIEFISQYLKKHPSDILEVNVYCGSFLPKWRDKDYRETYSAKKKLGGGVHLDLIHEPDYIVHLFGLPERVRKTKRKLSNLDIDSFDYTNYLFSYKQFEVNITLNYYRRDTKRFLEIVRADDTLQVDFVTNEVVDLTSKKTLFQCTDGMDESYLNQMKYFLKSIKNNQVDINSSGEAIQLLNAIL